MSDWNSGLGCQARAGTHHFLSVAVVGGLLLIRRVQLLQELLPLLERNHRAKLRRPGTLRPPEGVLDRALREAVADDVELVDEDRPLLQRHGEEVHVGVDVGDGGW